MHTHIYIYIYRFTYWYTQRSIQSVEHRTFLTQWHSCSHETRGRSTLPVMVTLLDSPEDRTTCKRTPALHAGSRAQRETAHEGESEKGEPERRQRQEGELRHKRRAAQQRLALAPQSHKLSSHTAASGVGIRYPARRTGWEHRPQPMARKLARRGDMRPPSCHRAQQAISTR